MSLKGENPITSYFPRISLNPPPKTLAQSKPKPGKRPRQLDEFETGSSKESSRKKSKGRRKRVEDGVHCLPSTSTPPRKTSPRAHRLVRKPGTPIRRVTEIQDTPTSSMKPVVSCITPPSSPLPDLTPSPEMHLESRSVSHLSQEDKEKDDVWPWPSSNSPSMEASYPDHCEVEPEFIPSSQTQALDSFFCYEGTTPTRTFEAPSELSFTGNMPTRGPGPIGPLQSSNNTPSSYATTSNSYYEMDECIASSQSQDMDLTATSPIDPDFELVPSSQTQELLYSQGIALRPLQTVMPETSERRTSLMDVYQIASPPNTRHPSPEGRTTRSPNDQEGTYLTESPTDTSGTISSSRTPAGGSSLSSPLLLTSTSEARWDDGSSSYESLPDAVKELQGMFGDTYESYPPDFPMSLR